MNLNRFLEELSKTGGNWYVDHQNIRRGKEHDISNPYHCPISAVGSRVKKRVYAVYEFMDAGDAIGLSSELIGCIFAATDNVGEPVLRTRILKAVGLKE